MPTTKRAAARRQRTSNPSQMVHRIKRTSTQQLIIQAADQLNALSFSLSAVPELAELTALFDQYTIERVDVTFRVPRVHAPATTGEVFPFLTWALDYNDGTIPASIDAIRSYDSCRIHQFAEGAARSAKWSLIPKANQTSSGGNFQTNSKLWLNTDSPGQLWHGIKWGMNLWNSTTFNNTVVFVDVVYHIALRYPK